ncbi:hypothetical protein QBC44DRAFT_111382 [Cladorrhinum sp. PSN332]|nr:hypothetical protein QBC44DRAFT_111382 [Cladorrhinum sp. PSN332]
MTSHMHLFRPRHRAVVEPLNSRATEGGPNCASHQTTCPQGGWCCNPGETCSFDNESFCCPIGSNLGALGCRRVCAAGDFECGSVCCATGQTCIQSHGLLPYCVSKTSSVLTAVRSVVVTSTPTPSTSSSLSPLSTESIGTGSTSSELPFHTPTTTITSVHGRSSATSSFTTTTTALPSPKSELGSSPTSLPSGGLPTSAQISIGIIVPLFVLMLLAWLWFCVFRNRFSSSSQSRASSSMPRRSRLGGELDDSFQFPQRSAAGSPPPSYMYPNLKTLDISTMSVHERYILESSRPIAPPQPVKLQTLRSTATMTDRSPGGDDSEDKVTGTVRKEVVLLDDKV